jgi:F-type H+-transporting ATPase subunit epsilon
MRSDTLAFEVVTPDRRVLSVRARSAVLPGELGLFGVLPGHHPFLAGLAPGPLRVQHGGREETFAIGAGFAEVLPDRVSVLVSSCERAADVDAERARAALERAERELRARGAQAEAGREQARGDRDRARARLRVAGRPPSR